MVFIRGFSRRHYIIQYLKSIILLIIILKSSIISARVNVQDSTVLANLYHQTNGESWIGNEYWLPGDVSLWLGMTIENNRVIKIELPYHHLTGTLSPFLGYNSK